MIDKIITTTDPYFQQPETYPQGYSPTTIFLALMLLSAPAYAQDHVYISQGRVQFWQPTGIEVCLPDYGSMSNGYCTHDDLLDIADPQYQAWKHRMDRCMYYHHKNAPSVDLAIFESGCEDVSHDN